MLWKEFLNFCHSRDWTISNETTIPYGKKVEIRSLVDKVVVNHFVSGKYSVQAKDCPLKLEIESHLGLSSKVQANTKVSKANIAYKEYAGSDESGKGDYFGPLVVAAVYVSNNSFKKLESLGVQDSKKIKDSKILELDKEIKSLCSYSITSLMPSDYNHKYAKQKNLNHILVTLHKEVHSNLFKKNKSIKGIVIDQFTSQDFLLKKALASLDIEVIQETKGEKYLAVACASIIARASFVRALQDLEQKWDFYFPKGASIEVEEAASQFIAKYGKENLEQVAKLHFATSIKIGFTKD